MSASFKILFYARGFKSWGTLVRMVEEIIKDMGAFLLILMVIVTGFGLAFWVVLHDEAESFATPLTSILLVRGVEFGWGGVAFA